MPVEIKNTLRGTSTIRAIDAGSYTVSLANLSSNVDETVNSANIKRVMWSSNGYVQIVRNSVPILNLSGGGRMDFDNFGHSIANNNTQSIDITIVTGGTVILEVSKDAAYANALTGF